MKNLTPQEDILEELEKALMQLMKKRDLHGQLKLAKQWLPRIKKTGQWWDVKSVYSHIIGTLFLLERTAQARRYVKELESIFPDNFVVQVNVLEKYLWFLQDYLMVLEKSEKIIQMLKSSKNFSPKGSLYQRAVIAKCVALLKTGNTSEFASCFKHVGSYFNPGLARLMAEKRIALDECKRWIEGELSFQLNREKWEQNESTINLCRNLLERIRKLQGK